MSLAWYRCCPPYLSQVWWIALQVFYHPAQIHIPSMEWTDLLDSSTRGTPGQWYGYKCWQALPLSSSILSLSSSLIKVFSCLIQVALAGMVAICLCNLSIFHDTLDCSANLALVPTETGAPYASMTWNTPVDTCISRLHQAQQVLLEIYSYYLLWWWQCGNFS